MTSSSSTSALRPAGRRASVVPRSWSLPHECWGGGPNVVQVVPLTRTIRPSGAEVVIEPDHDSRLSARSSAHCQHVRSVATTRIQHRTGNVGSVALREVRETLALLLDL